MELNSNEQDKVIQQQQAIINSMSSIVSASLAIAKSLEATRSILGEMIDEMYPSL